MSSAKQKLIKILGWTHLCLGIYFWFYYQNGTLSAWQSCLNGIKSLDSKLTVLNYSSSFIVTQ